jgi:hypothetical protein
VIEEGKMSAKGLQTIAFLLLVALVVYVAAQGVV